MEALGWNDLLYLFSSRLKQFGPDSKQVNEFVQAYNKDQSLLLYQAMLSSIEDARETKQYFNWKECENGTPWHPIVEWEYIDSETVEE